MGLLRDLILAVVPAGVAASMERDSRAWKLTCPCGHTRSFWEIGGIRWKAAGEPRKLLRCPACGKLEWHRTHWQPEG
ncbi:MAG: hypothetical protein KGQ61_10080 [Planctomycetes bacterium]|nr:hypothetical protein [Planctomycetota bacterium]